MSNFAGVDYTGNVWGARSDLTPALDNYSGPFDALSADLLESFTFGTLTRNALSAQPLQDAAGLEQPLYGGQLFEKVIVTPQRLDLGSIVSDIDFPVDVWNTHRRVARVVTAASVTGGGVSITPPGMLPRTLYPFTSDVYSVRVTVAGDPTLSGVITFTVTGETGTALIVTGNRVVIFDFVIDWSEGISEIQRSFTSLIQSYDGSEQRARLRARPRTLLKLHLECVDLEEVQYLRNMMYAAQARLFAVPLWPDAVQLLVPAVSTATEISIDTEFSRFIAGDPVLLWRGLRDSEAQTIASIEDGILHLAQPINRTWLADGQTWIVPLLIGRVADKQDFTAPSSRTMAGDVLFTCDNP